MKLSNINMCVYHRCRQLRIMISLMLILSERGYYLLERKLNETLTDLSNRNSYLELSELGCWSVTLLHKSPAMFILVEGKPLSFSHLRTT